MQKTDFNRRMNEQLDAFDGRPRVLLHACCAPCASVCLERLVGRADVTVLFYNPNITSPAEYDKRAGELLRFVKEAPFCSGVTVQIAPYDPETYYEAVRGLEKEPEKGKRCHVCYRLRLAYTAAAAKEGGFDFFATTLTLSPLKDAQVLNEIGFALAEETGAAYLASDFKKREGFKRSVALSETYGLYRQNFCGCVFSAPTGGLENPFCMTSSDDQTV